MPVFVVDEAENTVCLYGAISQARQGRDNLLWVFHLCLMALNWRRTRNPNKLQLEEAVKQM